MRWTHARATHAALCKRYPEDDPRVVAAREELHAAREAERDLIEAELITRRVERLLTGAPPLNDAQRELISGLLRPQQAGAA